MAFPFGEKSPKIDKRKVFYDIVSTNSKEEQQKLIDYLVCYEGCKNFFQIQAESHPHHLFGVYLVNHPQKSFSYAGIYVCAEQAYHGAMVFNDVDEFIRYRKSLMIN